MASNTSNVKVGVCRISYDGNDLGYTKGGVEVEVTTDTYKSEVDQFGKTAISEVIMGRNIKIKAPLAETTFDNLIAIMPGATIVQTGGVKASGTLTFASQPTAAQTVVIGGATITFRATATSVPLEVKIGATVAATVAALAAVLNQSQDALLTPAKYSAAGGVLTVTYDDFGTAGNAFTIAAGTSGATASGATLSGGTAATGARVDVIDGVGTNLLNLARELRLHPMSLPDNDRSEDFVIPRSATAGGLTFAYKLEEERVFNVEFMGYPDPSTRKLFHFGAD